MKHWTRLFVYVFLLIFVITTLPQSGAYETNAGDISVSAVYPSLTLTSKSYVLMDGDSQTVLLSSEPVLETPPASITKIMTLLLIMEAIDDGRITYDTMVSVSEHAASMGGSQVFLEVSEELSVNDMLKCICIASANDASVAMAEHLAGSEEAFVALMNERAKELGMNNTNFVNACGLDIENHYSCAKDVAIMSQVLLKNHPEITKYTTVWMDTIVHRTARGDSEFGLANTNKLIRTYSGITGLKTGSTGNALYCLSATASRDGRNLIAVIMSAPDTKTRFREACMLLDYGFANYSLYQAEPIPEKELLYEIEGALEKKLPGEVRERFQCLLPSSTDQTKIVVRVELKEKVSAPVKEGDVLGIVTYEYLGSILGSQEIYSTHSVKKAKFSDYFKKVWEVFL